MISQIIFLTIIIISLFFILNYIKINETFSNYLFPIKGLQSICAKEGLKPSFAPNSCIKENGDFNPYSNCMCIDKKGICKKCYPEIKLSQGQGRSTVYNPNDPLPDQ